MDVSKALEQRRSVRKFDPDHRMGAGEVERLLRLALFAPSSSNIQHWRFVVIRDTALREQVRAAGFGQAPFTEASLLVLICADAKAWQKQPERYWANLPEWSKRVVPMFPALYGASETAERDAALYSVGLSAMALMLAATEMGYGSVVMSGFDAARIAELVNLPPGHIVGLAVAIGKPTEAPIPKPSQLPYHEVVFTDRF